MFSNTSTRACTAKKPVLLLAFLGCLSVWQSAVLIAKTAPNHEKEEHAVLPEVQQYKNDYPPQILISNHSSERNSTSPIRLQQHPPELPVNKLIHLARFGAGHRLCRISTAWHFAKRLNMARIKFQWKTCGANINEGPSIFPYLFGNDTWEIEGNLDNPVGRGKDVLIRNDIFGYVSGQSLKDHAIPLSSHYRAVDGPFLEKLKSDKEFYQLLEDRYMFRNVVKDFMSEHDFENHYVIGVHLRAGNGEQAHFVDSGRGIANETEFVSNLVDTIGAMKNSLHTTAHPKRTSQSKPPLIFLATDTAYLVDAFAQATQSKLNVSTILFPQFRLAKNGGVTFSALEGAGDKCLQGWQAMFNDMFLLSHANVLIASQKSTFTQSLPMSLVFDRQARMNKKDEAAPHFCEVSVNATAMTCYHDLETWLFRDNAQNNFSYSTTNQEQPPEPVLHKLVVLLPDVKLSKDYADLERFLLEKTDASNPAVLTHTYGGKPFYPKYRNAAGTELAARFNIIVD